MLQDFLNLNIFAFFLVFARIGAAFLVLPGFSASYVTRRVRLGIALGITFLVTPLLERQLPGMPTSAMNLLALLAGEVVIGGFIGAIGRILMGTLQIAGTFLSYFASMANAFIQDPISEQQSSAIAGFLGTLGLVLVFVSGSHELMLWAVLDSYGVFQPGVGLPLGDMTDVIVRFLGKSFTIGMQLSTPLLLVALTYYVGIGLLGRLMPTLPVFFFGLPIQITIQIWTLSAVLSAMMLVFLNYFQEGYGGYMIP